MQRLALLGGRPLLSTVAEGTKCRLLRDRHASAIAWRRAMQEEEHLHSFWSGAVAEFERTFAESLGVPFALGVTSGTSALLTALAACGVGAGDEVITTPYTWPQVVSPILDRLAVPVFADIDPQTLTMKVDCIEAAVTERSRAIIVVHQFGHPADMTAITAVASRHGLRVIEDCAQALGACWAGKPVGSFGDVACFSLGLGKPVSGLEGGVLVTRDGDIYERAVCWTQHPARRLREFGPDDGYDGIHPCSRLHPLAAAIALEDLRGIGEHLVRRRELASGLSDHLAFAGVRPPVVHPVAVHGFHRYSPTFVAGEVRGISRRLYVSALAAEGVPICTGYVGTPVHRLPTLKHRSYPFAPVNPWDLSRSPRIYGRGDCPYAERRCAKEELGIDLPAVRDDAWIDGVSEAFEKVMRSLDTLRHLDAGRGATPTAAEDPT